MRLEKKMFRSNILVLASAFLALILLCIAVIAAFEDPLERGLVGQVPDHHWWETYLSNTYWTVLLIGILVSFGLILVLLVVSYISTKRLNRMIMKPVNALVAGAERVRDGNLEEPIEYKGEMEFENVCLAFNVMQNRILADKKQREANEKARTDMIAGISHDLRTPLTSIQGYIKGIQDGIADTEERKEMYLQNAYEAAEEMDVLLQKLFDFSRMESDQMPFHMVRADLAEFVDGYLAKKEQTQDPAQIQMTFWRDQEIMPEVDMDVDQIRRILDNLLENSIKYTESAPVRIFVQAFCEEDQIVLEWIDNGPGVPEDKLPHIFDRFYRVDEARHIKGSGIGLSVVSYIMKRHGGRVAAENAGADGKNARDGLRIRLYFPKGDEAK